MACSRGPLGDGRRHQARRARRREALRTSMGGGGPGWATRSCVGPRSLERGRPTAHASVALDAGARRREQRVRRRRVPSYAAMTTGSACPAARRDGGSDAAAHAAARIFVAAKLHPERRSSGGAAFIRRPPTFLTARNCICYVWRRAMFGGCNVRGFTALHHRLWLGTMWLAVRSPMAV